MTAAVPITTAAALPPDNNHPNDCLPPHLWDLTWRDEPLKKHENLLARRTYRLDNPDNPAQALWSYCDKFRGGDGEEHWRNLFGYSQDAGPLIRELTCGDFQTNVFTEIFRQATRRQSL